MDDLIAFLAARVGARQALIMQAVNKAKAGEVMNRGETKVAVEQKIRGLTDLELDVVNQMINEIEATRRILLAHRTTVSEKVPGFPLYGSEYWCETCHVPADEAGSNWCLTLRLLALPYADHPEYSERWRP
ncbi:hypothetical protein AMES_2628 [Amycolatopsis mediterranei S699]|uniref:Uncharacterized protein n=2 Tax=Amycolatopsis mediterranei TaxID=33910 RepID=A0A0H3D2M1_AMYMU|nr:MULTISPECIES: DUF6221 family protein [Amycolatopsis]ADJ44451.1 hypothetical protein AMED_2656 [Amycolatopsis mediterranei U32]AEK41190.1 hypothetical protein RAM_13500 [Amycolatopsis mediterranei S699]AFO76164.1 hypothetical protein AMES_2628 [Amycolatopsis mediterranei S699]AGT83293.1 hypothetical protein B737_2629 [Amycolatopsis mediterranei RB]KDO06631.1 hypothetical protein DV26_31035 [Amycolatopsis mediterranei]